MFAGKIESTLAKDTNTNHKNVNENSMEQNVIQINGGITINFDVSVKKLMYMKKIMFWINPAVCNCDNRKYLASIMDKIICDEIIEIKQTILMKKI